MTHFGSDMDWLDTVTIERDDANGATDPSDTKTMAELRATLVETVRAMQVLGRTPAFTDQMPLDVRDMVEPSAVLDRFLDVLSAQDLVIAEEAPLVPNDPYPRVPRVIDWQQCALCANKAAYVRADGSEGFCARHAAQ